MATTETDKYLGSCDLSLACYVFQPISYSKKFDTPKTVREIKEHNRVYDKLCAYRREQ